MKAIFDGHGDVIVITGGANGIGAALARAAAAAGAIAVVCDRDTRAGEDLAKSTPNVSFCPLDVANRDEVITTFEDIARRFGRIDGLVCGAAVQPRAPVHGTAPEDWRRIMAVNLDGVVWCYQAVITGMMARRRGVIIAFSSGLAATGWPEAAGYASSKAALNAFVRSAAKEVAKHRVRFNLIAPGVIDTLQYRAANAGADASHWQASLGVGQPEDVVGPLLFLLSDAASMTASLLSRDFCYPAAEDEVVP